ncbi:MAG: right-handed parallel beta-helix repeat-containing protein [Phycisphaerales bacterium]|nr:right-handed parallel beta-helix repeat-containing protein [Phycisphaerales bacterium]
MKQHKNSLKRLSPSLVIATLAVTTSVGLANRVEWPLSLGGNGHEYEVVLTPSGMNWSDARAAAEAAGGHLATVSDMDELDFINNLDFAGTSKGWIGGYQDTTASDYEEPDGGWRWVSGEPWSFVGWWDGGPSSSPTRNFVQLAYTQCQDEIDVANEGEWYVVEYDNSAAMQWSTNGHWYQAVEVEPYLNWEEASDLATAQGGHLATPVTEEEDLWIINTLLTDDSLWGYNGYYAFGPHIGGWQNFDSPDYSEPGGGWEWITGGLLEYTNWLGLDNCCGGQSRMQYYTEQIDGSWKVGWADVAVVNNEVLQRSYLVEWSADCNGDGIVDYGQILDGSLEDLDGNGIPDCCDDGSCATVTVAQDGTGDYTTIQEAINAVGDGTEIIVYPGTYTNNGGEVARFFGKNILLRSLDGPEVTIIDGNNARRGLVASDGESDLVIEGFTVTNCTTGGSGGGILVGTSASPVFRNMVITGNDAGWEGGGMFTGGAGLVTLESCRFEANSSFAGGGLALSNNSTSLIDGCVFSGNSVSDDGAGFLAQNVAGLDIRNSTFQDNNGNDDGGGLWFANCSSASVSNCVIINNSVTGRAGGMHVQSGSSVTIESCTLEGNTGHNGGAVFVDSASSLVVEDCNFLSNQGDGGAIQMQGGTATLSGSTFNANTGFDAGAVYCWNATIEVHDCEFSENSAEDDGGAMLLGGGTSATISLSQFCGNTAPNGQHIWGEFTDGGDNTFADSCNCPSDVDNDGEVNVNDVLIVIAEWGTSNPLGDPNGDGIVDVEDVLQILSDYGMACP